ncbi:O-Glycosyl hydrolases family 17 protein [Perilla frutescens var. hirtella]|uniref:glucan endo-1,3-beta-D-glucosidase n=1 Tax=Perilla frutescens var. hirtella TaxID=608512 RepID=A0AAD4JLS8_PERFH|nr:O-Glycosyl hydrolases family 17 protein [Perilla frutescens var. hirtella]KAH6836188.1 O-Glycosyl hydrolases family 17 protein [Perilla frutescens var. hirtella]
MASYCSTAAIFCFLLLSFHSANSQSFIGVNYGQVADNLPPPEATAKLLQSTSIEKVRLYGADPAIIKALANTGIGIVIGAANGDIPALASDPNFAGNWVNSNVLAYYPASKIIIVTVGNEVVTLPDQNLASQLLPAMQNVQNALNAASLGGKIKVSTVHSMAILSQSEPPSAGAFGYGDTLKALLQFLSSNGSPLMINPYPFFAYRDDPRPETLAFCLFQPNAGRLDSNTGIKYMNMWDAQVDAIYSALKASGFKDVEIVVAETGWPYKGDPNEVGTNLENAKGYNGNLINHLRSKVGTPLMPGKSVDTYIFALYDENLKPGPASERSFGLFNPDLSATYDVGLAKSTQTPAPTPATPEPSPATPAPATHPAPTTPVNPAPTTPTSPVINPVPSPHVAGWCVPMPGISDAQLQANLDYACSQGIDCSPIQPGGACFEPATVVSHAAYAMNLLYQSAGRNPWNCDFLQTATISTTNPSYDSCVYPGGST